MHAIVLAGGKGTRLRPYTLDRPKALVPIGARPIIEITLRQLASRGFSRVTLCVAHLAEMIRDELGDGAHLGLRVDYSTDRELLGTAGPLASVAGWDSPALVMNADVLTTLDFGALWASHAATGAEVTVAVQEREVPMDFGIYEIVGDRVRSVWEKPRLAFDVCTGIYVISPDARRCIPPGRALDMPDLIAGLLHVGAPVHAFAFAGEWFDIGTPDRLEEARRSVEGRADAYGLPERSTPTSMVLQALKGDMR